MDNKNIEKVDYIDEQGFYVIENYDKKQPFASFLAGIAGVEGIPMWSFYVNRGQGISSFGIENKNNCIMEFFPANEAYKMVHTNGFRTFLKVIKDKKKFVFEPFSVNEETNIERIMKIKNNELRLVEINNDLDLEIEITYFTIPKEDFSALGRRVKVYNNSKGKINIEILDGLSAIIPYGVENEAYKSVGNTLRSWIKAEIKEDKTVKYQVRASTGDTTKIDKIDNSYFYVAFDENTNILKPIIDPEYIFGYDTSLRNPIEFKENNVKNLSDNDSVSYNKVPCAFSGKEKEVGAKASTSIYSYIGYVKDNEVFSKSLERVCSEEYFNTKINESNLIIEDISKDVNTETSYTLFDKYIKQCYIDNVLRGGYPMQVGDKVYYVYSRKHGDLERDYNFFSLEPNYYSQGNGNFRDVNQNRRMDIFIHPFTGMENIKLFSELIQMDGYNPLVIKGKKFYLDENVKNDILKLVNKDERDTLEIMLDDKFTLGELYGVIKGEDKERTNELLNTIVTLASEDTEADFAEGFWVDHWTYNLDLIEEFLNVYPDKEEDLLIKDENYKFYNSPEYVLPRKEKYVVDEGKIRQYVTLKKKENDLNQWLSDSNGNIYKTNLFTKLFMLAGIKFMSLDMKGFGIEMEAGKPGWNDAMNGLPGLIGSSFAETAELKRLLIFIKEHINVLNNPVKVPEEFYIAMNRVESVLSEKLSEKINGLQYWDKVSTIRENFREQTNYTVSGINSVIEKNSFESLINKMIDKIDLGIEEIKSLNNNNIPTFMYYNITEYSIDEEEIKPLDVEVNFLPLFLEGYARYFKTNVDDEEKRLHYNFVKNSDIFDKKLKMYKTSESLEKASYEIGRAKSFTPGWLERESIFMHMGFKYLLELLKNGLYEEFYVDLKEAMPPFMEPKVYGRSILENSSFIASSSNPDERNHGRGFIARLSGTTVEMINIWKLMMFGSDIFTFDDGVLRFKLNPILSKDFFKEGILVTTLLGNIEVTYINKNNKDTFGPNKGIVEEVTLTDVNNNKIQINNSDITGKVAEMIRNGEILKIEAVII
ncbi:hypothetical protein [Clostridium sp. DL1XJH146]